MWHVPKLRQCLCLRAFGVVIYGKSNSNQLVFFSFFVWPVNYSSLTCSKLWILFQTFRDMWTVLKYYRIFCTVLYRKINFNCQPVFSYFLLVYKLYNLIVFKLQKAYFRHVQQFKRYLSLRSFNAFSFTESSILTIKCTIMQIWKSCNTFVFI